MRPQTKVSAVGVVAMALAGGGCSQSGLSAHEGGRQSYPMLMYTAATPYDTNAAAVLVRTPTKVAVAQVGEVAPPQAMLDGLRGHPELFRRVVPVTGVFTAQEADAPPRPYSPLERPTEPATQSNELPRMRAMAAGLGMDYLLVFGGTIDHGEQGSGLQLLDLTIVGAFVVPSHGVTVNGRAAGSLIDVHTGQVVMNYSAEAKGSGAAPTAFVANVEEGSVLKNRDELIQKLTADVVGQMADEAKANSYK